VDKLRPAIAAQVEKLLDRIGDAREFDIVRALAQPLPSMVVTFILGIPLEDNELIGEWSDAIIKFAGANTSTPDEARTAVAALSQATAYFRAKIEERRQNPREDFISRMVADCPADFDLDDLASQCVMIATAGHKTTRDVIAAGVLSLLRHPDALQELRDNPALIRPAVEEILRYESPNQIVPRFAREDMVLHGVEVKRGEVIGIMLASANRDRRCFEDPERFDIKRRDNTHIAFGGGPHACIGSYLARVDIQIAILGVVQRFPKLQLAAAKIDWEPNFAFRGLNSLLVSAR
jgi:cytochrome P450